MENDRTLMSEKILVVDDDEKICQILSLYLRSKGYEVFTCQSGSKAITSFEEFSPDLVLLDVMLPGMDGWEILKRIRKISNAPVIMLTAKGDTTDRVQGLDCGADDYVVKPFDSKELIARIRAVMRRSGQPEEIEKHIKIGSLDVDTNNRVMLTATESSLHRRSSICFVILSTITVKCLHEDSCWMMFGALSSMETAERLMFTSSVCAINLDRAIFGQFEPCGGSAINSNALIYRWTMRTNKSFASDYKHELAQIQRWY